MSRTAATELLWAHLRPKETRVQPPESGIPLPPIAPVDKNGTSIRILLHDTQANFEKFSARIDKMIDEIGESKLELISVKKLFDAERESLSNDLYELVNRCQAEIQKALGSPAQAPELAQLDQKIDLRLDCFDKRFDAFEKRFDAVQLLVQTCTQTLQTQAQTLQSLQDQQGTMITALMPLLPLLQAVPLHIDSVKTNLTEALANVSLRTPTNPKRGHDRTRTSSPLQKKRRMDDASMLPPSKPTNGPTPTPHRRPLADLSISKNSGPLPNPSPKPTFTKSVFDDMNTTSPTPPTFIRSQSVVQNTSTSAQRLPKPFFKPLPNDITRTSSRRASAIFLGRIETPKRQRSLSASRPTTATVFTNPAMTSAAGSTTPSRTRQPSFASNRLAPAAPAAIPLPPSYSELHERESSPVATHPLDIVVPQTVIPDAFPVARASTMRTPLLLNPNTDLGPKGVPQRQRRSPFRDGRRFIPLPLNDDTDEDAEGD